MSEPLTTTIITDCFDPNAAGRQIARAASLLKTSVNIVRVESDLAAAGNLIDILDALESRPGIILVNIAPRNGHGKHWENGTPFGYFNYGKTLVLTTIDGLVLSLLKKLELTDSIQIFDLPKTVDAMAQDSPEKTRERIKKTQFRSFEFLPRVAAWMVQTQNLENQTLDTEKAGINQLTKQYSLAEVTDAPSAVWWIDNFGNCKTTLFRSDIEIADTGMIETKFGKLKFYERLKDVPDGEAALIEGSSGINNQRFLEIVVQGGSAAQTLKIQELGSVAT